jgi:hypothetical protein
MATLSSLIPPGSVISETGTATLTNKTIDADQNTLLNLPTRDEVLTPSHV